jgi:hypothetical protein
MYKTDHERYKFAQQLYCFTDKTIADIATITGIPERSLYRRAADYKWSTLRRSSRRSPMVLAEQMYQELADLTASINSRPIGQRIPTPTEAELRRKILYSIRTIKKFPTHSEVTFILESLQRYSEHFHYDRLETLRGLIEGFLAHRDIYGYASYQPEHNQDLNQPTEQELELFYTGETAALYRDPSATTKALNAEKTATATTIPVEQNNTAPHPITTTFKTVEPSPDNAFHA